MVVVWLALPRQLPLVDKRDPLLTGCAQSTQPQWFEELLIGSVREGQEVMSLVVASDSILRNPPTTLPPEQIIAFDALRFAFDMLGISYDRLLNDLTYLSDHCQDPRPDSERVASAFLNVWSFADGLHRLHQLLRQTPGLKRTPDLEVAMRGFAQAEDLRHTFQHLRIRQAVRPPEPLWGSILWFWSPGDYTKGGTALTLVPGAIRAGHHELVNPLGKTYSIPLGLVTLCAFEHELQVSDQMLRVRDLASALDRGLRAAFAASPRTGADVLIAVSMTFGDGIASPPAAGHA